MQDSLPLLGTGGSSYAGQGLNVALSADGKTALIGGPFDDTLKGAVWVFAKKNGVWTQQGGKLVGTGSIGYSEQGYRVSLSADGKTALIGGWGDNSGQGAVWVFKLGSGGWNQQGEKISQNPALSYFFGAGVALSADGKSALISCLKNSTNQIFEAWLFKLSSGVWSQEGDALDCPIDSGYSYQFADVALNAQGTIGLIGDGNIGGISRISGAVWLFQMGNGRVFNPQPTKFVGLGSVGYSYQGIGVALSSDGNTFLEGGDNDNNSQGAAWVFANTCSVDTPKIIDHHSVTPCAKDTLKASYPLPLSDYTFKWYSAKTAPTPFAIDTQVVVGPGTWYVKASGQCDNSCTSSWDSFTVKAVSLSPPILATTSGKACAGYYDTLRVTWPLPLSDYTFHWYNSATGASPVATGPSFAAAPGNWWVDATPTASATCISARTAATVALVAPPKPPHIYVTGGLPNPAHFCTDYQLSFDVSYREDDVLYQVYFNGNPLYGLFGFPLGSLGRTYGVSTTGLAAGQSYPLVFKSYRGGCETDTTINIKIFSTPAPTVSARHGYTACSGRPDTLTATRPLPISSYTFNWYDSPTSVNYVYRGPAYAAPVGTWYVDATAVAAPFCTSPRIAVTVNPAAGVNPGFTSLAPAVCSGEPATITLSNLISGQSYSLVQGASTLATIQGNGARGSFTIQPDLLTLGSNFFTVQVSNGCPPPANVPVSVTVNALPSASTIQYGPQGTEITSGETAVQFIVLGVSNAAAYLWDFGDGTTSNEASPAHTYAYGGSFTPTLKLSSKDNCTDLIRGPVIDVVEQEVLIPNAFTPNGDGVNDTYYITAPTTKSFEFKVYDRLGNLVYQSEDAKFDWSGKTLKGDACPVGVYGYILTATFFNGTEVNRRGSITLLR